MFKSNLHAHSIFSDGKNTIEEYVLKAIDLNFKSVGISDHSYVSYAESYCMKKDSIINYVNEVNRLKIKYQDKIEVYLGIEWDLLTDVNLYNDIKFDYIISGVHFFYDDKKNEYIDIDENKEKFSLAIKQIGLKKMVSDYYKNVVACAKLVNCDIIAHFDLVKKFNRNNYFFDENEEWYKEIVYNALLEIKKLDKIIELNSGAISRGYLDDFYPSNFILEEIKRLGVKVTLGSDAHNVDNINYYFDNGINQLKNIGIDNIYILENGFFNKEKIR